MGSSSTIPCSFITAEEEHSIVFHDAHTQCRTVARIERGERALVGWCKRCMHLQACEVNKNSGYGYSVTSRRSE
jgi:hypothetical protein